MPTNKNSLLLMAVTVVVALNLSWEHQSLLTPMVTTTDYYHLQAHEPFIYRILPALIYRATLAGRPDRLTGLNAPFDSSFNIFQLVLDAICLSLTFLFLDRIVRHLNPALRPWLTRATAAAAGLMIVVFGFFMIPNRAFFYPYDFPDLCLATVIFYLCMRLAGRYEYLLPLAIFVATLNKETAIYYSGLYLALRAAPKAPWARITTVLASCAAAFIAARTLVASLIQRIHGAAPAVNQQYEFNLMYNLGQITNPLFVFAMLNICSYLYVAVYLLRRRLDRTDVLILLMIAGWVAIMATVGIVRELRIFVPASLMMFVIIARHLQAIVAACSSGVVHSFETKLD